MNPENEGAPDSVGIGILSAVVWPTYAGAVNEYGIEPIGDPDYDRGQIFWSINEQGRLVGHTKIRVPPGKWTHIIYCYAANSPTFITAQKLAHPFIMDGRGDIDLIDITDGDVAVMSPDRVFHD